MSEREASCETAQGKIVKPLSPTPRPIFIIGSPRSGTSILTWCLGQHPDILPLEEGNWLDKFALELGSTYECGTRRGERAQLAALGISRDEFYESFGSAINALILSCRDRLYERAHASAVLDPTQIHPSFKLTRETGEPKLRWTDGTPEYSLCVYGLLKLFPEARFIHVVRDVKSVVRSLVRFSSQGQSIVRNEREAYEYWLRTTRACVTAEQALGPGRIRRVRHVDLMKDPVRTFTGLLDFLGEPFCPRCLEPLEVRINSSKVPPEFDSRDGTSPTTVLEEAEILSDRLQRMEQPSLPDLRKMAEVEDAFWDRVRYVGSLDAELDRSIANYVALEEALADRTEWAQKLVREIADRDETIRRYQHELGKRTIRYGLWRFGQLLSRRLRLRPDPEGGSPNHPSRQYSESRDTRPH